MTSFSPELDDNIPTEDEGGRSARPRLKVAGTGSKSKFTPLVSDFSRKQGLNNIQKLQNRYKSKPIALQADNGKVSLRSKPYPAVETCPNEGPTTRSLPGSARGSVQTVQSAKALGRLKQGPASQSSGSVYQLGVRKKPNNGRVGAKSPTGSQYGTNPRPDGSARS